MHPSAHNALAVSIIVSAAGALTVCVLLFRYGFTTWAGGARRAVIIRLGHAFAAVCFTITAVLAAVALSAPPRSPAAGAAPAGRAEVEMMTEEVRTLARRVDSAESALRQVTAKATERSVAPALEPPPAREVQRPAPPTVVGVDPAPPSRREPFAAARPASPSSQASTESRRSLAGAVPPPTVPRNSAEAPRNPSAPAASDAQTSGEPRRSAAAPMTRDVPSSGDMRPELRPSAEMRRSAPASRDGQPTALATDPTAPAAFADTQAPPRSAVLAPVTSPRGEMSTETSPRVEPSPSPRVDPSPRVERPARAEASPRDRTAVATAPPTSSAPAPTVRAARDPSEPYSWDESIDEAVRLGHDIKNAFTNFGRKVKGVFRRD